MLFKACHLFVSLAYYFVFHAAVPIAAESREKKSTYKNAIDVKHNNPMKRFQQRSNEERQLSDNWIAENSFLPSVANCPCDNPKWCEPIRTPTTRTVKNMDSPALPLALRHDDVQAVTTDSTTKRVVRRPIQESEIYGFADSKSTGKFYNWTHITTVAWASADQMMCRAHQNGARAILASPSFNLTKIAFEDDDEDTLVHTWVNQTFHMVRSRHSDGIVFDYESPIPHADSPESQAYVKLIGATYTKFHSQNPPLQVSTCVAWSPDDIDDRHYPIRQFAKVSDLLYVMDYDTQSQITQGPCIANANAPFSGMKLGLERYLEVLRNDDDDNNDGGGVAASTKLILGVPWYGYRYPCLDDENARTRPDARFCPIKQVPFRGINCSDAAGREIPYSKILQTYYAMTAQEKQRTGGIRRDDYQDASFFNTIVTTPMIPKHNNDPNSPTMTKWGGVRRRTASRPISTTVVDDSDVSSTTVYQYWFDDPQGLRHKYAYAKSLSLGGVGPFTFDDLDPVAQPNESKDMWSALDAFTTTKHMDHDSLE